MTATGVPGAVCLDNPADSSGVLLLFMLRNGTNAERMFLSFGCCASSRVRCGWSAEVEAVRLLTRGLPEIALMCGAIQQGKVCWQNDEHFAVMPTLVL